MRLAELEPKFVTLAGWSSPSPFYIGVRFLCPHCRARRLVVFFHEPIDPNGQAEKYGFQSNVQQYIESTGHPQWHRTGDTFETLSLTPSVNAEAVYEGGHWHGFITNGEIR